MLSQVLSCVCNVCGEIVASSGRRVLEVIETNYLPIFKCKKIKENYAPQIICKSWYTDFDEEIDNADNADKTKIAD